MSSVGHEEEQQAYDLQVTAREAESTGIPFLRRRGLHAAIGAGLTLAAVIGVKGVIDDEAPIVTLPPAASANPGVETTEEPAAEAPPVEEPETAEADLRFVELEAMDDIAEFNEATDPATRIAYAEYVAQKAGVTLGNLDVGRDDLTFAFDRGQEIYEAHLANLTAGLRGIAESLDATEARKVLSALMHHDVTQPGINNRYESRDGQLEDGEFPGGSSELQIPLVDQIYDNPPNADGLALVQIVTVDPDYVNGTQVEAGASNHYFSRVEYQTTNGESRVALTYVGQDQS